MKKSVKSIILLSLAVISALLYRAGGWGKPFKTWMRDWIIPIIAYGSFLLFKQPNIWWGWLMFFPAIALTGAALTTYWDNLFGGVDNFYMHGFMVGLAAFPLYWIGVHWYLILARAIILGLVMGLINKYVNKWGWKFSDWIEELARGFLITITILLLIF